MSTTAQAAPQVRRANKFELQDQSGNTKITYYPVAPGPPVQGQEFGGSLVEYSGPEGKSLFRGSQVAKQDMPIGQMICVDINAQNNAGPVTVMVCLPPVAMGNSDAQSFSTFCVRATKAGNASTVGAQMTYETASMQGSANIVFMPR